MLNHNSTITTKLYLPISGYFAIIEDRGFIKKYGKIDTTKTMETTRIITSSIPITPFKMEFYI